MQETKQQTAYIGQLIDCLTDENMSLVDFDHLTEWLRETVGLLDQAEKQKEEYAALRKDYIARISAMRKAVAAVGRRDTEHQDTLEYLETLPSLSARDLISHYRKASSQFRDAFPTSFQSSLQRGRGYRGTKDLTAFK